MPVRQKDNNFGHQNPHSRANFFPPLRQYGRQTPDSDSRIRKRAEGGGDATAEDDDNMTTSADDSGLWFSDFGGRNRNPRSEPSDGEDSKTGFAASRDPSTMDTIISAELNQLGQERRILALEDLHGVSEDENPDADTIESHITTLLAELKRIRERTAFDKAMFLAPNYVTNRSFCLMFLRAERFDVKAAARRLVLHFKYKLELFGLEKIGRDITLDDLNAEDKMALMTGSEQYLGTDRSGRSILFSTIQLRSYKNIENQIRAMWYLAMLRLRESDGVQQKGVVVLKYDFCLDASTASGLIETQDKDDFPGRSCSLLAALPLKIKGFHFCYDDDRMVPSLIKSQTTIGRDLRVRLRSHNGTYEHCLQALRTYGIPKEVLPVDQDGSVNDTIFKLYVEEQHKLEHDARITGITAESSSILPSKSDILLGRGRPYQEYPGNLGLTRLIDKHRDEYAARAKSRKIDITNRILDIVKSSGGRFLKKSSKGDRGREWVEASTDEAREKVSHGFRAKPRFVPTKSSTKSKPVGPITVAGEGKIHQEPRTGDLNPGMALGAVPSMRTNEGCSPGLESKKRSSKDSPLHKKES